jgi:hypothetical protein
MDILTETDNMDEVNRLEAEQCSSTSVQLVQLPTHSDTPGVSMVSNTGAVGQTRESERCSSTSTQLVQLPTSSEDQYRSMTPGEEEIMRIYEDGIYRAPDLIERTGGFWITGRISPLLESTVSVPVDEIDSDPELDELLRDSPDILEPSFQETVTPLRTATSNTRIVTDALQRNLEDMFPWLRDGSPQSESSEVACFDQLRDGDPRVRESFVRTYRGYLRLRSRIENLETQLRNRGILWMAALPLDRLEPSSGSLEILEELDRLRELRVIQRMEVMQQATRWAHTQDSMMTPGAL